MRAVMDSKERKPGHGRYPDVIVMGRPLREWAVEDTGQTTEEMFAWKRAVVNATGSLFDEAVGLSMTERFEIRFERLAEEEHVRGRMAEFEDGARALGFENARITSRIEITPPDGNPRRFFAGVASGETHALIGLAEGKWRIFDIAEVLGGVGITAPAAATAN